MRVRSLARCAAALLLAACCASATADDLIVSAASSLANAFSGLGKAYEQAHPQDRVVFNFAASGTLLQQIVRGAPVDVLACADQETMDQAQRRGLIVPSSRVNFARNTLVVVVAPGYRGSLPSSLAMLRLPAIRRIAIGNPETVPAGRYAKGALEAAGLWEALSGKLIRTQNVRQSLDYVAREEVEAAFVYGTDARSAGEKVRVAFRVDTASIIAYPIARVKNGPRGDAAARFVRYVNSERGRSILAGYGFLGP